jgi:predicted amidohydrolase
MRLALAQPAFDPAAPLEGAVRAAVEAIRTAAAGNADLVLFSELFLGGYRIPRIASGDITALDGPSDPALRPLEQVTAETGMITLIGAAVAQPGKPANALLLLRPGRPTAVAHRKYHLWSDERRAFSPGETLTTIDVAGVRVGLGICYDAAFPAFARRYTPDCQVLAFASAFAVGEEQHRYRLYHPARALETGCFVAVANALGTIDRTEFFGESAVYDPWGHPQLVVEGDATGVCEIDPSRCDQARRELGYLDAAGDPYPTPTACN